MRYDPPPPPSPTCYFKTGHTNVGAPPSPTCHFMTGHTQTWAQVLNVPTGVHLIIGRTQLSDVALFRAFQTQICEMCIQCRLLHEKLKPHRKNGQITVNNKHFTVKNVCPPYPPTKRTCGGSQVLQKLKLFSPKIANIIHLSYSLDILI